MAERNEHVIAIMLEPVMQGYEFVDWPLHITLASWFPCSDEQRLDEILEQITKRHQPFNATVGEVADFGTKSYVPVNLVNENSELENLHRDIFNSLEQNGFSVHQKDFMGDGYKAHITQQKQGHMNSGDKLDISSFTAVKQVRLKKTGTMVKTIGKKYELG